MAHSAWFHATIRVPIICQFGQGWLEVATVHSPGSPARMKSGALQRQWRTLGLWTDCNRKEHRTTALSGIESGNSPNSSQIRPGAGPAASAGSCCPLHKLSARSDAGPARAHHQASAADAHARLRALVVALKTWEDQNDKRRASDWRLASKRTETYRIRHRPQPQGGASSPDWNAWPICRPARAWPSGRWRHNRAAGSAQAVSGGLCPRHSG